MKLFRGLATEVDPHWADHLLDSGVIPSFRGGYLGISALRNSDVLTAVSIVSGDVSRFPLVITDSSTDEVVDLANIEYLMNTKVNKRLSVEIFHDGQCNFDWQRLFAYCARSDNQRTSYV